MSEVTKRELVVWSAYLGTALSLNPKTHDLGEATLKSITKAKEGLDAALESGELSGSVVSATAKAAASGVDACELDEGTHPSIVSKVRVVRLNLQAVVDQIGGTKSGRAESPAADDTTSTDEPKSDGKVDCPCGKRHAEGSKVLARHQAKAEG